VRTHPAGLAIPADSAASVGRRLTGAAILSAGLSAAVLVTAAATTTPLGAPRYWPWLLTGLQVLALWSAGTGRWWGWLLGGCVQLPWIAYAVVTTQFGFIPGCTVSASVQIHNFLRGGPGLSLPAVPAGSRPRLTRPAEVTA
jgi:hypothetical protein